MSSFGSTYPVLIGDIGGTSARLAVIPAPAARPEQLPVLAVKDHSSAEAGIEAALETFGGGRPRSMVLATAAPLIEAPFKLVNAHWVIDPARLITHFGLAHLSLMNDFVAQGLAAIAMDDRQLEKIGSQALRADHPKLVLGPGTGLGAAHLVPLDNRWLLLPSEAGHADLGPMNARDHQLWPYLRGDGGRISVETVLSGPGLERLYRAICAVDGHDLKAGDAASICRAALADDGGPQAAAVRLFLTLLARHAGNLALTSLATGGVYLAGGMTARTLPMLDKAAFREAFEDKAPSRSVLHEIGIAVLPDALPALQGLANCLDNPQRFDLRVALRQFAPG